MEKKEGVGEEGEGEEGEEEEGEGEVLPCHGFHDSEIPGRLEVEDGADIMVRRLEPVRIVVEVMEEEVEEGQEGQEREEGEEFPEMPGQLEVKAAEKKLKRRGRPRGSCYRPPDPSSSAPLPGATTGSSAK